MQSSFKYLNERICDVAGFTKLLMWSRLSTMPRRPTIGGGTPFPCLIPSSPCVPIGRAGCTLLVGLLSMLHLTVFGTGVIACKSTHDHRLLVGTGYELPVYQRDRLVQYMILIWLTFWTLEPSRDLDHPCFLAASDRTCCDDVRVLNTPGPTIQVLHFDRREAQRFVSSGIQISSPEEMTRVFEVSWTPYYFVTKPLVLEFK